MRERWKRGTHECLRVAVLEAGESAACTETCRVREKKALEMLPYASNKGKREHKTIININSQKKKATLFCDEVPLPTWKEILGSQPHWHSTWDHYMKGPASDVTPFDFPQYNFPHHVRQT